MFYEVPRCPTYYQGVIKFCKQVIIRRTEPNIPAVGILEGLVFGIL